MTVVQPQMGVPAAEPAESGLMPQPAAAELRLADVMHALSDPIRLRIVAELADGAEHTCGSIELPVVKSTCTHHYRVLREAGVVSQRVVGKTKLNALRRQELEERFPGLLSAVLAAL